MLRPIPLLAVLCLLPAAPALAAYPTDECVAAKLEAAAAACGALVDEVGRREGLSEASSDARNARPAAGQEERYQAFREALAGELASRWQAAEAASLASGLECSDTTEGSDALLDRLEAGANGIVEALRESAPGRSGATCVRPLLQRAAAACEGWLAAYGEHLRQRDQDRDQAGLGARLASVTADFERGLRGVPRHCGGSAAADVRGRTRSLLDDVLFATTVSPSVSSDFSQVVPDAEVEYRGRVLEPICSGGTPWSFWVRRGTVNKLLVYYQGGGACWSGLTCGGLPPLLNPVFKQTTGPGDNPANFDSGFADLGNPENPFRDWHLVFIPYCTGDVHWGDAVVEHVNEINGRVTTIHHKGYVNAQVAEKWAREHFVFPEQVFVTGSSAGSYGALVNSLPLQEFAYPSSDVAVLGDAGNGVITDEFLENDLAKWGIEQNLPEWIPALNVPIGDLDSADLWSEAAKFYHLNRFATYTSSYDGGTGGQSGFYNIMRNPGNFLAWLAWWNAACDWNVLMRDLNDKAAAEAPNFRFYVGAGARHTMWGSDKVYSDTTGNVPTIRDWVAAMIEGNGDWRNVACDDADCGTVLPGDPTPPNLPTPPFTADGRIVCD